jgi:hypothetical protein
MRSMRAWPRLIVMALLAAAACVALAAVPVHADPPTSASSAPFVASVASPSQMDAVTKRVEAAGGVVQKRYRYGALRVRPRAGTDANAFAAAMRSVPGVKSFEREAVFRAAATVNDPYFPEQWALQRIGAASAWDPAPGAGGLSAGVDPGAHYQHPDLSPTGSKVILGPDLVNGTFDPFDDYGHGTAMSGMAAGTSDNATEGAGVAPDATILAIKVLNYHGWGYEADIADGIRYAADNGADIINLSLAGTGSAPLLATQVAYAQSKGCLVIAASGNVPNVAEHDTVYPAAYPGVIGVGATASSTLDVRWPNSAHGPRPGGGNVVTVVAPGEYIYSLWLYPLQGLASGTSASTAEVSGAAAVLWSHYPDATAADIASLLTSTALDIAPAGVDAETGAGRIQLDVAVTALPDDAFVPRAPSGIALASLPPGPEIRVSWVDDSASEAGFVVERSRNTTAAFSTVVTVGPGVTSYDDTGVDWTSTWYYRVRAFNAAGSSAYAGPIGIKLIAPTLPVYRFYNTRAGVHFYTSSEAEKTNVQNTLSSVYRYEGVAYHAFSTPAATVPLYRFYNTRAGVHFYTASEAEKTNVLNTLSSIYRYEGVAYYVTMDSTGTQAVYRFYNRRAGVHFYTASDAEKESVRLTLSSVYDLEGVAFYVSR